VNPVGVAIPETEKQKATNKTVTMNTKFSLIRSLTLAAAVAAMMGVGNTVKAEDKHLTMKGAEHLQHLNSPKQAEALKKGDTITMVCSKCKTVAVTRVTKEWKGGKTYMQPGTKHGCSGCGSEITVVGQRMDQKEIVKHVCKACGDDSAFCCATKRDGGKTEVDKK
jgi:predicted RNA-binding Zn-ribbon protein involved in translation (DUF1610 family)